MEGRIDVHGNLFKNGKLQICPFAKNEDNEPINCSDWCPHFGEPKTWPIYQGSKTITTKLELCHGKTIEFDEFKDERK